MGSNFLAKEPNDGHGSVEGEGPVLAPSEPASEALHAPFAEVRDSIAATEVARGHSGLHGEEARLSESTRKDVLIAHADGGPHRVGVSIGRTQEAKLRDAPGLGRISSFLFSGVVLA